MVSMCRWCVEQSDHTFDTEKKQLKITTKQGKDNMWLHEVWIAELQYKECTSTDSDKKETTNSCSVKGRESRGLVCTCC